MRITAALGALRALRASKDSPVNRVAIRWIKAALSVQYDQILRLQVLEGVAGVPDGTWTRKGTRAFPEVAAKFSETSIDPAWVSTANSGMAQVVGNLLENYLRGIKAPSIEPEDVINGAIAGMDIGGEGTRKKPATDAGKILSEKILAGKDSPKTVAGGMLGKFLIHRAQQEAVHAGIITVKDNKVIQRRHIERETEEEGPSYVETLSVPQAEANAYEFMSEIIFHDFSNPMGKEIRKFMRHVWAKGTPTLQKLMDTWQDKIEQNHTLPRQVDLASETGIPFQNVSVFMKKAWKLFFEELWKNNPFRQKLQNYFEEQGYSWFPRKPDPDKLVKKRASSSPVYFFLWLSQV